MKKLDNKGFALAEMLVVSVFVLTIFTLIFTNFYPIIAEYEKREKYDDVDGKYAAYWMKRIIEDESTTFNALSTTNTYETLDCTDDTAINNSEVQLSLLNRPICKRIFNAYQIEKVYVTKYQITEFKGAISSISDTDLEDYTIYLPEYKNPDNNHYSSTHRIILKMHRTRDDNDYYAFSNMEVKK